MKEEKVKQRWKEYFDNLLNQENPREREERERDVEDISGKEVRTGLRKIKKGKAQGPDDISVEAWIALGNNGLEFLVNFFNIDSYEGRRCQMNGGGACFYLCTKVKETSRNVEITELSSG